MIIFQLELWKKLTTIKHFLRFLRQFLLRFATVKSLRITAIVEKPSTLVTLGHMMSEFHYSNSDTLM